MSTQTRSFPPEVKRVLESLSRPEWDYRTISGITKETKLSENVVRNILKSHPELFRESIAPTKYGEELFTLAKNVNFLRDALSAFRMINEGKFR